MSNFLDDFLRQQAQWRELLESPLHKLVREQEELRRLIEPTTTLLARESTRLSDFVSPTLAALLEQSRIDLSRFEHPLDVPAFRALSEANLDLFRMREIESISRLGESLSINNDWVTRLAIEDQRTALSDHLSRMGQFSALAELRFGQVDWDRLGAASNFQAPEISLLREQSTSMTSAYLGLVKEFGERLTNFPPIVSEYPPIELLKAADLLVVTSSGDVSAPEVEEVISASAYEIRGLADEFLGVLDGDLLKMLQGARAALGSGNPDRVRHVSASLRELATHVLHRLAPDKDVKAWSKNPSHFHQGRPTRRGRLEYIARTVSDEKFSVFLDADFKAAVELFELFQGGTHKLSNNLTDKQLEALIARAESLIYFLFRLPN